MEVLDRGGPAAARASQELAPGRRCCHITADEAPTALEALRSDHALVRSHAARVLGDHRPGRRLAKGELEALVQAALIDAEPDVRRLAALGVEYWKKTGAKYKDRLEPLLEDPDEKVRDIARYLLEK